MNKISSTQEKLNDIALDKKLAIIFIIASVLNLIGIDIEEKDLLNNTFDNESENGVKIIFIIVLFISLYVYYRIYQRNTRKYNKNITLFNGLRLFVSILFVVNIIILIYIEINESFPLSPEF